MDRRAFSDRIGALWPRALRIAGLLFLIDGISLLGRGAIASLWLFSGSPAFIATFLLHMVAGGALYACFGYALMNARAWATGPWGWMIAATCLVWGIPTLRADYFTAGLGAAYFALLLLPRLAPRPAGHP